MATIKKRKIGKKYYYYLEHSYKLVKERKVLSKYLGTKKPKDIEKLKKEIELEVVRKKFVKMLLKIKKNYLKEFKKFPNVAKQKYLDNFVTEFTYNSNKIEGSKLSFKDTANLFIYGKTPKNKPLKDVNEAEGHREAFYSIVEFKGKLNLKKVLEWHNYIFKNSDPVISGKIRLHKIMVTGSRVSFPHPEDLDELLKGFFSWYNKNNNLNPVEFAALVHLKFVTIHPFSDGNGRISRLLANYILYRYNYPLFNIKFEDRESYFYNLEKSQLWKDEIFFLRFFIKKYLESNKEYL